ncbi:hypothetical protein ACN4EG_20455 [Alkalinema pantanalense CENA528]|uniref:hypothetical protein n=1 Tax=Alkalinema pantanalense TaxID=1620705 RepID=UPI003D6E9D56
MAQLTLNLPIGSVGFSFTPDSALEMKAALNQLMDCLKVAANKPPAGTKVAPQKSMEYRYTGDVFLELFCNPNIYPTPFAAKVLVTLRDDRIRVRVEGELMQILEDLNQFLEAEG